MKKDWKKKMEKEYLYRKHLRKPGLLFGTIIGFFAVVYIGMLVTAVLVAGDEMNATVIGALIGIGVFIIVLLGLEFLLLYFILFRRFKNINIKVKDDEIIYKNLKGTATIKYDEITKIKFPSLPYIGGWVKIIYGNKQNIRLTVVVENIGDFILDLKNKMDSIGKQDVYIRRRMFSFYKTAKYSDYSWERLYKYTKRIGLFILLNLLVSVLIGKLTTNTSATIATSFLAVFCPIIVYLICEIILAIKAAGKSKGEEFYVPDRDEVLEGKIYKYAFAIYSVLYIIIAFLIGRM
ncbi:hypothetical protein [Clostridium felsineum]|nr:hypothetical protein [Clostridium felsineum]